MRAAGGISMAKKPNVLKGLILLLESMSEKEADEALKKIGIRAQERVRVLDIGSERFSRATGRIR
jgi:hypothetical protein